MDSSDRSTLDDVCASLDALLLREDLKGLPLLVFATKQDIEGAMAPKEVEDALNLHKINDRPYRELCTYSIVKSPCLLGIYIFVDTRFNFVFIIIICIIVQKCNYTDRFFVNTFSSSSLDRC